MSQHSNTGFVLDSSLDSLGAICDRYRKSSGNTIPILQDIQEEFGYVPEEAVNWVADSLDMPRSRFFGVATFYAQFHLQPRGKNIVTVCCGTACHVKGSEKILNRLERDLGLGPDEQTTKDLKFTLERVNCVGACSIAPVVIINKKISGKASADRISRQVKDIAGAKAEE